MKAVTALLLIFLPTVCLFSQTLTVLSTTPTQNANTVSTAATITIDFDHPIDTVGIADQFVIMGSMRAKYHFSITLEPSLAVVHLTPSTDLIIGELIAVSIKPTLQGSMGENFDGYQWSFRIKPALQTDPNFTEPVIYGQFNGFYLYTAQVNSDESVDLLLDNGNLLNNDGLGNFSIYQNIQDFGKVWLTDMDLDFNKDIIFDLRVYEQRPDGFYYYEPALAAGYGDMNRDGYPDRLFAEDLTIDDTLTLLGIQYNNGSGQMGDPDTLLVDTHIRGITSNDFNNDGINDIAYFTVVFATPTGVGGNNSLRIVYMDSNGDTLYRNIYNEVDFPYGELGMPFSIQSADFNNDGYADILLMTNVEDYIVFNDTQGGFNVNAPVITGGGDLYHVSTIGDANGDGWLDLIYDVVIGPGELGYTFYLNNNNAQFNTGFTIYEQETAYVNYSSLADFNGDGALDIASTWGDGLYIHFNSEYNPIREEEELGPLSFQIIGNYPNPFNNETTVQLYLPTPGMIKSKIYDITGKEVKYFNSRLLNAGLNKLKWDGKNNFGKEVSSGIYIYVLMAGKFKQARKMVVLK